MLVKMGCFTPEPTPNMPNDPCVTLENELRALGIVAEVHALLPNAPRSLAAICIQRDRVLAIIDKIDSQTSTIGYDSGDTAVQRYVTELREIIRG